MITLMSNIIIVGTYSWLSNIVSTKSTTNGLHGSIAQDCIAVARQAIGSLVGQLSLARLVVVSLMTMTPFQDEAAKIVQARV